MDDSIALDANARRALRLHRKLLTSRLNVQNIIDSLVSAQIVTPSEKEKLNALGEENTQAVIALISILESKPQHQWIAFLSILRGHNDYQQLATVLECCKISSDDVLMRGGVPILTDLIERAGDIDRIHAALQQVLPAEASTKRLHPTRIVLIHGMGGIGKTYLAAESLRSCPALSTMFKHGVIWKSVSHVRQEKTAQLDEPIKELLEDILKHPVLNLNKASGQQQRTTLNQLKDQLRAALLHCSLLLAIDDVWQEEVLRAFDGMRVTILATCRNRLLTKTLDTNCIQEIEVNPCSNEESQAILKIHCLDDEEIMQRVMRRCQGLPIALSAVASLLRGKRGEQQQLILKELDAENMMAAEVKRSEYKYLDQVLEVSLRDLEQSDGLRFGKTIITGADLLQRYLDLAAMENGEPLFADKLAALLCTHKTSLLPRMHVDRVLEYLHKRSLLTKTGQKHWKKSAGDGHEQDIFTVHDVQLEFLRMWKMAHGKSSNLDACHKQWVNGFLKAHDRVDQLALVSESVGSIRWGHLSKVIRVIAFGGVWRQCYHEFSETFLSDCPFERAVTQQFIREEDKQQWTLLHDAAYEGHCELAEALVKRGADINARVQGQFTPLHLAAQDGHRELVEALVKLGADINARTEKQGTPLHLAAECGHPELAETLVKLGADINARTENQNTPLHMAAPNGHRELAEVLVKLGANINAREYQQATPLHFVAQNGHRELAEVLVKLGADINARGHKQATPLHVAAQNGHRELAEALVKLGAEINAREHLQFSPLHLAAQNGHRELAEALIKLGADVNAREHKQTTPLHFVAQNGHREFAEVLVKLGADINAQLATAHTPLHLAAQNGHREFAEVLVKLGADINAREEDQFTSLHLAAHRGHRELAEALVKLGADINARQKQQFTPLHVAAQNGHCLLAEALITLGADINARHQEQFTPLHVAAQNGHRELVEVLVKLGADINAREEDQYTPLHLAAQNGHREVAEALIKLGADVNAREHKQATPLHFAAKNGHRELAEVLVKLGADINARLATAHTPLHLAAQNGHREFAETLVKLGADINARTVTKATPLFLAALSGHRELAEALLLLLRGADINATN